MIRYVLYAAASLAMNLFVILTAWAWAIAAATFGGLGWFSFLHTHDDDVFGSGYSGRAPAGWLARWKAATWWMMRNPAYGFDAYVLGFPASRVAGKSVAGTDIRDGILERYAFANGSTRFFYRRDLYYRTGGSRYIKMQFGWKRVSGADQYQVVFDINPFKKKD
jgi:hypothetical protein